MASSILDSLSKNARAAYPAIVRGVREGLSAEAIGRALSDAGLPLRRQVLLDLVRVERGLASYGSILRSLGKNAVLNATDLPAAATKIRRGASFVVELVGQGPRGQTIVQHVTVSTDQDKVTPGAIERAARDLGVRGKDRYGMDVTRATIIRGVRAGAEGTFQDDEDEE